MLLNFVILVAIIPNLMVGLAVSDIQELRRCANFDRLKYRAELITHIESMYFKYLRMYIDSIYKFSGDKWATRTIKAFSKIIQCPDYLYIRPNNPREKHLPRELITEIYNLVSKRKSRWMPLDDSAPSPPHTTANETRYAKYNRMYNESNQQQLNKLSHELKRYSYNICTTWTT